MITIRDWLYIGKYGETFRLDLLRSKQIGAMLLLAELVEHPTIASLYVPAEDGVPLSPIHLRAGVDFILAQQQDSRKVLVACGAGISRSPAFATAALKEAENLSLAGAYQEIKKAHPDAFIHPKIWRSLCSYYQEDAPFSCGDRSPWSV